MELTELPLMAQSTYAELLELANMRAFKTAFAQEGTFSTKTAKDRVYWYLLQERTPQNRPPTQRYVGQETEELRGRTARGRQGERESAACLSPIAYSRLQRPRPAPCGRPGGGRSRTQRRVSPARSSGGYGRLPNLCSHVGRTTSRRAHANIRCRCGAVFERVDCGSGPYGIDGLGAAGDRSELYKNSQLGAQCLDALCFESKVAC